MEEFNPTFVEMEENDWITLCAFFTTYRTNYHRFYDFSEF